MKPSERLALYGPVPNCPLCRWIVSRRDLRSPTIRYACGSQPKGFGAYRALPKSATRPSHEGGQRRPKWCPGFEERRTVTAGSALLGTDAKGGGA